MSLFHDDYPVTSAFDLGTALLLLVLLAAVAGAWRLRRAYPLAGFGFAWFLVSHLMESSIFPLELVFEHRNYLALAGLLLVPVDLLLRFRVLAPARLLMPVFIVMLAGMTYVRAGEWGRPELFHLMAVTEHPGSPRARNNYINVLIGRGEHDKVLEQLQEQIALSPTEAGARLHLLIVRCEQEVRDPDLLGEANDLLARYPASVYAQNALQLLVQFTVESRCRSVAVGDIERLLDTALALPLNQKHDDTNATLMRLRGLIALNQGFYAQAYAWFMTAYDLRGSVELLTELMKYQLDVQRFDDARDTLALVEVANERRHGLELYQLQLARNMLEAALDKAAQQAEAAARSGAPEPAQADAAQAEAAKPDAAATAAADATVDATSAGIP